MPLENDSLLFQVEEIVKSLGTWKEHVVIAGGMALIIYDCCMTEKAKGAVGTTDIDFLINRKPNLGSQTPIAKLLENLGFSVRHKDLNIPSIQSYVKTLGDTELEIEFLTDAKSRNITGAVSIERAGITAQPLSYIEMSLKEHYSIRLPQNTVANIVSPEAWVFHKGLTFVKRTQPVKRYKDLYGIWFVLAHIQSESVPVEQKLKQLQSRYAVGWKKSFEANLVGWINAATPKDWGILEQQDPHGRLSRVSFQSLVNRLISE